MKQLKEAGFTIALDGCGKNCARACMETHGLGPTIHMQLSDLDVPNVMHQDFNLETAGGVLRSLLAKIEAQMAKTGRPDGSLAKP